MKTILVPVDFNPLASAALRYAALFATRTGATLVVVYADTFEPPAELTAAQLAPIAASIGESRRKTSEELARYARESVPEPVAVRTEVREALPLAGILAAVEEQRPDLLIMGTHGRGGLSRLVFGSVAEAVLRETSIPVLTIHRPGPARPPQSILCIATPGDDADALQAAAAEVGEIFGAPCRQVLAGPDAAAHLVASPEAAAAGMIVLGGGAPALIRHAAAPVLRIRRT